MKLVCVLLFLLLSTLSLSQDGSLDNSFNDSGKVHTAVNGQVYAAALQQDGKILAGGVSSAYILVRYLSDGSLDNGFGVSGIVSLTDLLAVKAIDTLSNGKIIIGAAPDISIVRHKSNGSLDSTFGTNGVSYVTYGEDEYINAIKLQTDGKILVAGGSVKSIEGELYMLLVRLNANGTPDSSFGINGRVINKNGWEITSIALQQDGKIITAGHVWPIGAGFEDAFVINRYKSNGTLDSSFGLNGMVLTDISNNNDVPHAVKILPDGKIIAAGTANYDLARGAYAAAVKYKSNGDLDSTFGVNGIAKVLFATPTEITGLVVQTDGKFVLTGYAYTVPDFSSNFALFRLKANGSIDSSFAVNGKDTTDLGGSDRSKTSLLQPDGKIVLAGDGAVNHDFLIARFNSSSLMPLHFTYFNAAPTNKGITLNWQTAQESNNNYFSVQRSGDSRFPGNDVNGGGANDNEFEIARINSQGNSSNAQTYSYTDNTPLQGTNFYKLKQVDKDGKFSYSQIVSATIQNGLTVILYPNPVKDVLNIKGLDAAAKYEVRITNVKGSLVAQTSVNNTYSYSWNLQSLSKGVYYLTVISSNKKATVKFVKE